MKAFQQITQGGTSGGPRDQRVVNTGPKIFGSLSAPRISGQTDCGGRIPFLPFKVNYDDRRGEARGRKEKRSVNASSAIPQTGRLVGAHDIAVWSLLKIPPSCPLAKTACISPSQSLSYDRRRTTANLPFSGSDCNEVIHSWVNQQRDVLLN